MKSSLFSKLRPQTPTRRRLLQALGFACLVATAHSARAQTPYTWDGGTGNWSDSTFWNNGVPNDPTADVYIDGGNTGVNSIVTMDNNYTVGRLTVDAGDTLTTNNGTQLSVTAGSFAGSGSIIDNGTINLTGGYYNTVLVFNGPGSLSGTGTLNLANGGGNLYVYENNSGDLLTVGAGFTVAGAGNFGEGQTTFLNKGTINANSSGNILNIQPGGGNITFTNSGAGLVEATGGGILQLNGNNGGVFTGGTFQALDNSQINLTNNPTISGAVLTTAGTGTINNLNNATLSNVTNNGVFNTTNGNNTFLAGMLTNNGTLNVNGGYYTTTVQFGAPVTLAGTGTLQLNPGGNLYVYADNPGDRMTINSGATIAGTGNLGDGQTTFLNNGLVNANSSGNTLTIQPGGGNATYSNGTTGLTEASGGGTLQLNGNNGGVFTGGTFQALDGSSLVLTNNPNVSSATLTTAGTGTITNVNSATLTNATNNGAFTANNGTNTYLTGTLTNNGSFSLTGGYYSTNLQLTGPVTLAGTGTFNLADGGANLTVYAQNSGDRLTIGASQTVIGAGNLGGGQTTFTNNGLVNANSAGNTLTIQPGGGNATYSNGTTGLTEATGGGILQLNGNNGGVFTGGTFQALDGSSLVLTNNPNVSSATLTTAGTGTITNVNSATLTNATNNGAFTANNGTNTYLTGTLTNNGSFSLTGGYYSTNLQLTGPVTLAGTGTFNLADGGANLTVYAQNSGDRLTIGASQTVIGAGNLGGGQTTFTNNGLVNANSAGNTLTIQPGGTAASGADFTNAGAGLAEASGGGTLQLNGNNGGVFTGGTFQALDGSSVTIVNGANVSAATLTTAGSGTVTITNSTLTNVTNNGTTVLPNSYNLYLAGTLTNNGTVTANGGYYNTNVQLTGPVTLAGTGTLTLASGGNLYLYAQNNGDLLTINAGATIQGTGNLGDGSTTFLNNGTVNANSSGNTLTVQPTSNGSGAFTNGATGLVEATGGGLATLSGNNGGVFTNQGTFAVASGSTGGNSSLSVDAGRLTNYAGTTLTGGTYNVIATDPSATSTLSFGGGTITTNAANVTLSGANTVFTEINSLNNNQGSFTVANGRNFTTGGALSNSGTLVAAGGSTLTVDGTLSQSTMGTLAGNGTYTASAFTLSGNINPGGTVSATTGAYTTGAGTTTLNGDASFDVNSKFNFELGAMTGTNDHLNITGALNLNGTLNVTALAGFGVGDYDLIDYKPLTLTGNGLTLGNLPPGFLYQIIYLPGSPTISFVPGSVELVVLPLAVPEPGTWPFVLGGAVLLVGAQRLRRSARHGV